MSREVIREFKTPVGTFYNVLVRITSEPGVPDELTFDILSYEFEDEGVSPRPDLGKILADSDRLWNDFINVMEEEFRNPLNHPELCEPEHRKLED